MQIKSIKLQNIRSYLIQEIKFPAGNILLSGDIGTGKSTILLAIEFALFGIKRGYLSGHSLLRHGKNEGSIELNFEAKGNDILIKRSLKRMKDEVAQGEGYIILNGMKKNCSPIELRSEVFEILGYPKDLLTKNRDMVYRYTVYTPQEEMKQILTEDREARLDILRRIFNIDKYKRIKENALNIFLRELREKKRFNEHMIADLDTKKNEKKQIEHELKLIDSQLYELNKNIDGLREEISKNKKKKQEMEQKIKALEHIKNDIRLNETKLKSKTDIIKSNKDSIERIKQQIEQLESSIDKELLSNSEKISIGIKTKEAEIEDSEKSIIELTENIAGLTTKRNSTEEIIKKISSLDVCPSCFQKVPAEYKNGLISTEGKKILLYNEEITRLTPTLNGTKKHTLWLKQELNELRSKAEQVRLINHKLGGIKEKSVEKKRLEEINQNLSMEIGLLYKQNSNLHKELERFGDLETMYKNLQAHLDSLIANEREFAIKKARADYEKANLNKMISQLETEITEKEKQKEQLVFLSQLNVWTNEFFLNLMDIVERHIMLSIYHEFNVLFQRWFSSLIDDDTISVRIDEEFTPIIEQNGYDTTIENLSGGEKTSVALAYRLALNKVINDIISGINTKDILILDEPTDGFSTEQLDKVRDVLNQIAVKQLIIVSHEPKIESFVDTVIRIEKQGHESGVIT